MITALTKIGFIILHCNVLHQGRWISLISHKIISYRYICVRLYINGVCRNCNIFTSEVKNNNHYAPAPGGGIKQWCCLTSSVCLSDVCRIHGEYSWRPQLTGSKTRWVPQARRVWSGTGPQRAACTGAGAYRGGFLPTACCYYIKTGHLYIVWQLWHQLPHSE